MNFIKIIVVIIFTYLCFVAYISYGDLIYDVCQKTNDVNLCVKPLIEDAKCSFTNKKGSARIMILLAQPQATF